MADLTITMYQDDDLTMPTVQKNVEQSQPANDIINNDPFYPAIELVQLRNAMRIDSNVPNERLKEAALHAVLDVNTELEAFKAKQLEANVTTLADIKSVMIDNQNQQIYYYLRAVYCLAVATLYERYASYDLTNDGEKRMMMLEESIGDLRRDARFAIRAILGKPKITATLL